MQVPDWHPGNPRSNREIFEQDSWQANYRSFFGKLISTYPGVVGKLAIDLVNVSPFSHLLRLIFMYLQMWFLHLNATPAAS